MNQEARTCQNCKNNFEIEAQDFDFYERMGVPPPTLCRECRMIQILTWRNERSLYKRTCAQCGKNVIAMLSPSVDSPVYCRECWYSDSWDPATYAVPYDFNEQFFVQWRRLLGKIPFFNMQQVRTSVNSSFVNYSGDIKNCYLSYSIVDCENVAYSSGSDKDKDCFDCAFLKNSELCFWNVDGDSNYQSIYLLQSRNCVDAAFLFDCINCQNCMLSTNLRNRQYVIRNIQKTREEYEKEAQEIFSGSFDAYEKARHEFYAMMQNNALHRFAHLINSPGCTGDNLQNSKNTRFVFGGYDLENIKNGARAFSSKDSMDVYGLARCELMYGSTAPGFGGYDCISVFFGDGLRSVRYSALSYASSNLFGCVGIRNKQYCIFNRQYTKEEYESLVPKIIAHMNAVPYVDTKGRIYKYGDFFPQELSPFAYNETIAQEFFPLTKEEVLRQGLRWKDPEEKEYKITINSEELPDKIQDAPNSIVQEVIGCAHRGTCIHQCSTAFKIIPQELEFYRRMNLPLPRLCPNCRHYERLNHRNPLKLWHRPCMKPGCTNEFETSYAPERPEIVYCESCYQKEVV